MTVARLPLPASLFVLVTLAALSPGCSCSDPAPTRAICSTLLLSGCGDACGAGSPCAAGLYCASDNICEADCTPTGDQCRSNQMCSDDGQCVARDTTDVAPVPSPNVMLPSTSTMGKV